MAIVNSVGTATAGYGSGYLVQKVAQPLVDGANTITLSTSVVPLARGKIRVKVYGAAGTSPALTDIYATATDGTNTVRLGALSLHPAAAVALSTTSWVEMIGEFLLDTGLVSGNGGASGDLIGTGATSFSVVITISGTGETATADVELCGEP